MFELDEKEKKELEKIEIKAFSDNLETVIKRRPLLREAARKKGITADELGDLKSKTGEPFVESKSVNSHFLFPKKIRMAVVFGKEESPCSEEVAYLCRYWDFDNTVKQVMEAEGLEKDPDSCGWVKGIPQEEDVYDEADAEDWKYVCRICGQELEIIEWNF